MLTVLRLSLFCLAILLSRAQAAEPRIALVYNGGQEVFQQFADSFEALLRTQGQKLERHDSRNWNNGEPPISLGEFALVIAAGSEASSLLAKKPPHVAILSVLLSRQQFEQHLSGLRRSGQPVSAIFQDPPVRRQLLLAQQLLPALNNIGYLYEPSESAQLPELTQQTERLGLKLIAQPVAAESELPTALVSVIGQSEALLASVNSNLYNRYTIKTILTAAYRQERVVIGSSPAFVKAGSLATTFSSIQHIAKQVSEWLASSRGQPLQANGLPMLPVPGYARYFEVSCNTDVARSLNIRLPDNDRLTQVLIDREQADAKAGVTHE